MSKARIHTRRQWLSWLGMTGVAGAGLALQACGSGGEAEPAERRRQAARLQAQAEACVADGLVGVVLGWQDGVDAQALSAVAGRTRLGATPLRGDERFLIGSNTKAMTAALAARCVEQGLLQWDSRPADLLPGVAARLHPGYQDLTLRLLLDHRGGVPAFQDASDLSRFADFLQSYAGALPVTEATRRLFFADWLLSQTPAARPGQAFLYSNAGYALAGAMLEAASGEDFKTLFARQLAGPLQLDVGWGAPQGRAQPSGHGGASAQALQVWMPLPPEQQRWMDLLSPGGAANMSSSTYLQWLHAHQLALQGRSSALPRSYITRLQSLRSNDYALGWLGGEIDGRALLLHSGAAEGFMSLALLGRDGGMNLFAMSNTFGFRTDGSSWVLERLSAAAKAVLLP